MAIFKEKSDKLNFIINSDGGPVEITLTNQNGTEASVSYSFPPKRVDSDNPSNSVGSASQLAGRSVAFSGAANNPMSNNNKVKHTISQGTESLTYIFPDDYSGDPSYADTSDSIAYEFSVNFNL